MTSRIITFFAALFAVVSSASAQQWSPAGDRIMTPWAEEVSPSNAHPEYPRPQMVRQDWKSLNGLWEYSITPKNTSCPQSFDGSILVPFAVESALSGVGRTLTAEDALWYKTSFTVPSAWKGKRLMLNFEAVDWRADVFVNDVQVGTHTGGYTHFSFDVTPYLKSGANTLVVKVQDSTNNDFQPCGKQISNPHGIWYTAVSGIWQSVWMEPVAKTRIVDYLPTSDIKAGTLDVKVCTEGTQEGDVVKVAVLEGGIGYCTEGSSAKEISSAVGVPGGTVTVPVSDAKLWSPESPYLYGLRISVLRNGKVIDSIDGYTAMREVSVYVKNGNTKLCGLNGTGIFHFGPLDQGWWPDGLYTAPTDEALKFDIQKTKDFGFNMIRKHIKVEPSRWFYYCDQIGIMVWQDMPCFADNHLNIWGTRNYDEGTDYPVSAKAKANYYKEWGEIMDQLMKFQCIVMWVPFNEAWGQFDTRDVVAFTRAKDASRLINMSSGGNWVPGCGDVLDNHHYPYPAMYQWDPAMICVLGEYGGIGLPLEGHLWQTDRNWGYVQYKNGDEVFAEYAKFADQLIGLVKQGVSAAVYTQTTDVEGEVNGLMTYDRKVIKMDEAKPKAVNTKVIESMPLK
ncbi:MAG: beta-galactosidase [Bacteroidales bacterium]|nr:beta-galactosidase [Candidatus Cryptobacteroides faecihippi]